MADQDSRPWTIKRREPRHRCRLPWFWTRWRQNLGLGSEVTCKECGQTWVWRQMGFFKEWVNW